MKVRISQAERRRLKEQRQLKRDTPKPAQRRRAPNHYKFIKLTKESRQIFDLFILPLAKQLEAFFPESHISESIHLFFGADYRTIMTYKVTKAFRLPGCRWQCQSPNTPEELTYRSLHVGDVLTVRHDSRRPDRVDVNVKDFVFTMRRRDFVKYRSRYVRIKDRCFR